MQKTEEPKKTEDPSPRVSFRLPRRVHQELQQRAAAEGRTMAQQVAWYVRQGLATSGTRK